MIGPVLGVINIPFDPVWFHLGPLAVHWYGVAYAVAFFVGIRLVLPYGRRHGYTDHDMSDYLFWTIVLGLVGGRLYFVVQQPNLGDYLLHPVRILAVWQGGMAFFGAIISGLATLAYIAWRKGHSLWLVLDGGALFAGVPQAIGRLGNIVNGDILGPPSNLSWATAYSSPDTFAPARGVAYQPAGAYELLIALAIGLGVIWALRRNPPRGLTIIVYVAMYAVSQFLIFFIRSTEPSILFGLKQAQVTALVVLLVAVPALILLWRRFPDVFERSPDGAPARPQLGSQPAGDNG